MKKVGIIALFAFVFLFTGCDSNTTPTDYDYVSTGVSIAGETVYYRDYLNTTSCDLFELALLYEHQGMYYYFEPYLSQSNQCASSVYAFVDDEEYVEVRYAFVSGYYDTAQLDAVSWPFTVYPSNILPSVVTLADILSELVVTEKQLVYSQALAIESAARIYCASETCTATQGVTYIDLEDYLSNFDVVTFDVVNTGEPSGYLAVVNNGDWGVYLERDGAGLGTEDWEWTPGAVPSLNDNTLVIDDTNDEG